MRSTRSALCYRQGRHQRKDITKPSDNEGRHTSEEEEGCESYIVFINYIS